MDPKKFFFQLRPFLHPPVQTQLYTHFKVHLTKENKRKKIIYFVLCRFLGKITQCISVVITVNNILNKWGLKFWDELWSLFHVFLEFILHFCQKFESSFVNFLLKYSSLESFIKIEDARPTFFRNLLHSPVVRIFFHLFNKNTPEKWRWILYGYVKK